jgi:hypothetical protein
MMETALLAPLTHLDKALEMVSSNRTTMESVGQLMSKAQAMVYIFAMRSILLEDVSNRLLEMAFSAYLIVTKITKLVYLNFTVHSQ